METEWCKVGDIVSLKSRGPRMTVVWIGSDGVMCQWFNRAGDLKSGSFPVESLEPVIDEPRGDGE